MLRNIANIYSDYCIPPLAWKAFKSTKLANQNEWFSTPHFVAQNYRSTLQACCSQGLTAFASRLGIAAGRLQSPRRGA
jgi:hypothetical protein